MKFNGTWKVTRTVDANGIRNVHKVGEFTGSSARAVLLIASCLGGVAKYRGTQTHGEFKWGDVCYRAVPCRPTPNRQALKAEQDTRDARALALFFPPLHR